MYLFIHFNITCLGIHEVFVSQITYNFSKKYFPILKALHPLLEDGTVEQEGVARTSRCAFIGISNWALDPAKMNRGIFVQRGSLDDRELEKISR